MSSSYYFEGADFLFDWPSAIVPRDHYRVLCDPSDPPRWYLVYLNRGCPI